MYNEFGGAERMIMKGKDMFSRSDVGRLFSVGEAQHTDFSSFTNEDRDMNTLSVL